MYKYTVKQEIVNRIRYTSYKYKWIDYEWFNLHIKPLIPDCTYFHLHAFSRGMPHLFTYYSTKRLPQVPLGGYMFPGWLFKIEKLEEK